MEVVARFAASPEAQEGYLRGLGVGVDELALEFDDLYVHERLALTDQQAVYASEIGRRLDEMSRAADSGPWSFSALGSDRRWADLREIAAALLTSFIEHD
ncbi:MULTISPECIES: hypothetical protein [unclassified Mycolicibacterium]|uniref:hypothetical protein n=1 Tax=unclassified Mycolicibacterium TaxID=2636767 RepID=UPI00130B050C|nr:MULTISPECIES: hypothetical protein [unclassified Mycolicibacterium]MUL84764.1 hypothetical protein [Mycolicibacterium sp. CBMA 329]MUL88539.1 hypothetical protein [Mycolicibacterium sp. CBMA 331]MUM00122.1 hypothetical protein [Mycolicibacterium sp. CBMA 334]MUM27788.1 hypothetical protein [Mycolicibacterium sp. CBMA 295]MUM40186.1 hypothetical protein [Mycolicibacterium sp. CBMA 247]